MDGVAGEIPQQAHHYLTNSRRAAENLLALVNDLLDFAKLEAGKIELNIRLCKLEQIMEGVLSVVRPQMDVQLP